MPDEDVLRTVVAAISDGGVVNWDAAEVSVRTPAERALLNQLRAISALARPDERPARASAAIDPGYGILVRIALELAALKVLLGIAGWLLLLAAPVPALEHPWPYITNLAVFAGAAAALVWGGRGDPRARDLGALFLVIASAFSDRLLLGLARGGWLDSLVFVLRGFPADAFLAFTLWRFVWSFPSAPFRAIDQRVIRGFLQASLAIGLVLFGANAVRVFDGLDTAWPLVARLTAALDRASPASYYAMLLFGIAAPALPYLVFKSRFDAREERRRAALFAASLAAGVAPMLVAVLISPFVNFFDNQANRELVGVLLYISLISIVPLTAYAVLVHRVIDFRGLITRTLQYAMVRNIASVLSVMPIAYLTLYVYVNRDRTVADIVGRQRSVVVLLAMFAVLVALRFRRPLLRAIDRRFLRTPPDYPQVLARLERDVRDAHGVRDVAAVLERETERALHPRTSAVLMVDDTGDALVSLSGMGGTLDIRSTLGRLLQLARKEIYTGVEADGPVERLLPDDDRRWLSQHGFRLLVPLTGSTGDLLGAIALGEKRSGLPFSTDDRLLLATMASHAAVIVENRSFHDASGRYGQGGRRAPSRPIDWDNEPAALCPVCRTVAPAHTASCACGAAMTAAALPLLVQGKFRVLSLIGSGGMGVVYLAIDVALDRKVAIKTLPRLTADHVARLQREARTMAAARHPNLAMIFGVESWRGAPLLVVEYLDGGTLADRLKDERLTAEETVSLGIVLADVLDRVHASGVLHRDIKPTNIAFTKDGVPKLLDFGIASMLEASHAASLRASWPDATVPIGDRATIQTPLTAGLVGTPLYLSPEALAGEDPDPSFDLWTVSLVLYEAMAGQHPFRAATPDDTFDRIRRGDIPDLRTIRPDAPEAMSAFFTQALARDRERRPRSAGELRTRLQDLRSELRANGSLAPPRHPDLYRMGRSDVLSRSRSLAVRASD